MARKIELKRVAITAPGAIAEDGQPPMLDYGRMIDTILRWGPPGRGLTLEEVTRAVEALAPLSAAIEAKASEVVLGEDHWRTLTAKLDEFPFGIADPAIVEFGRAIRDAPELGAEAESRTLPRRVS